MNEAPTVKGSRRKPKTTKPSTRSVKKRDAQDRVLAMLAREVSITDAMKAVGRGRECFYQWCKDEPWFKERSDGIRQRTGDIPPTAFVKFRKDFFGYSTPPHQRAITDAIDATGPREITLILLPPGGGKTSVLEDYICYQLGPVDPNHRICVLSETRDHGRKILRRVSNRMVDTDIAPEYIKAFGPFKAPDRETSKPWNADLLTVVTAKNDERDYSLEVRSAGSKIYGARYDLIILDDFQSVGTLNLTDKRMEYFRQDVFTRAFSGANQGKVIIIGTRVGPDDFYERLIAEDMIDHIVQIPALDEDGNVYWPFEGQYNDRGEPIGFTPEDMAEIKKKVGEEIWSRVYMQEPQSKSGQTFTDDMIENALDKDRDIDPDAPPKGVFRIATMDPAISGQASFGVADLDYEHLYLLDNRNIEDASTYERLWDEMEDISRIWHPNIWVIEGNNIQGGILRSERVEDMERKYGFTVVAHQTGRNKMDEIIGVASMAGAFLRREIRIPWGTERARKAFEPMIKELRRWRADIPTKQLRQDNVMKLWFAYLEWQRQKSRLAVKLSRRVVARGLPYKPTAYPFAKAGR